MRNLIILIASAILIVIGAMTKVLGAGQLVSTVLFAAGILGLIAFAFLFFNKRLCK